MYSDLYVLSTLARSVMSSSVHGGYRHTCDSPVSEGADYATESDIDHSHELHSGMNLLLLALLCNHQVYT